MIKFNKTTIRNILISNLKRESKILGQYACPSSRGIRRFPTREKIIDKKNLRNAFSHDADKILYSQFYSRYIDKTQVFYLSENDHITRRALHVQLVSKIARIIGRSLRLNEDLIEAIALGHDIGHAPFGHNGETYLNELCKKNKIGRFIHNAQSVRNLMEIDAKNQGLNLTLQVLDGILCHNGEILSKQYKPDYKKTWDVFLQQYNLCFSKSNYDKHIRPNTLEGCVVRISDIIAYVGRDIEDAITLKLIKRGELPKEAVKVLGNSNDKIVNSLVIDILNHSYDSPGLAFSEEVFGALEELKSFNYKFVYGNPKKAAQDERIKNMFNYLFEKYCIELDNANNKSYIVNWAKNKVSTDYFNNTPREKIVIDYMAGMTDDFIIKEYKQRTVPTSFGYNFES
ncbi:MAG: HD domain-containing protein [Ignavibacteriales bacterium]|nr:HD domain-containing protein [Ignavibacteriales bacterium]